jgi:hypothetical protein
MCALGHELPRHWSRRNVRFVPESCRDASAAMRRPRGRSKTHSNESGKKRRFINASK